MKGSRSHGTKGKHAGKGKHAASAPNNGRFSNVVSNVVKDVFGFAEDGSAEKVDVDLYALHSKDVGLEMESICYVPTHPSRTTQSKAKRGSSRSSRSVERHVQITNTDDVKLIESISYPNHCETLDDSSSESDSVSVGMLTRPLQTSQSSLSSQGMDYNSNNVIPLEKKHTSRKVRLNSVKLSSDLQLTEKVENLEYMYEHLLFVLEDERKALLQLTQEREVTRKYLSKSFQHDLRAIVQRINKLEAHVVSLARSVAYISSDVRQQSSLRDQLMSTQVEVARLRESSFDEIDALKANILSLTRERRLEASIRKLKRFFGEDPSVGLLEEFLRRLGYEKYMKKFAKEHIGIMELPYLREDQFDYLGIPRGPRQRILAHLKFI